MVWKHYFPFCREGGCDKAPKCPVKMKSFIGWTPVVALSGGLMAHSLNKAEETLLRLCRVINAAYGHFSGDVKGTQLPQWSLVQRKPAYGTKTCLWRSTCPTHAGLTQIGRDLLEHTRDPFSPLAPGKPWKPWDPCVSEEEELVAGVPPSLLLWENQCFIVISSAFEGWRITPQHTHTHTHALWSGRFKHLKLSDCSSASEMLKDEASNVLFQTHLAQMNSIYCSEFSQRWRSKMHKDVPLVLVSPGIPVIQELQVYPENNKRLIKYKSQAFYGTLIHQTSYRNLRRIQKRTKNDVFNNTIHTYNDTIKSKYSILTIMTKTQLKWEEKQLVEKYLYSIWQELREFYNLTVIRSIRPI